MVESQNEHRNIVQGRMTYDILEYIFLWCLPSNALDQKQPCISQAPMLLCHICAYWRYAALSTPSIWISLYYVSVKKPTPLAILDGIDIDFLRWWRSNIGTLKPSLRLIATESYASPITTLVSKEASGHASQFMIQLLSSAQYLQLDIHYCMAIREMLGNRRFTSPVLDTLVLWRNADDRALDLRNPISYPTQYTIPISQNQRIRRLFINSLAMSPVIASMKSIMRWSCITHLFMDISVDLDGWFSFLGECTNLVAGVFSVSIEGCVRHSTEPPKVTLSHLHHLSISSVGATASMVHNIHLPSLTALSLNSPFQPVPIINWTLASTPALKELHLGPSPSNFDHDLGYAFVSGDLNSRTSLRDVVPELEFIHFGGRVHQTGVYKRTDIFRSALTGPWIQLGEPGNRIKHIELSSELCHPANRRKLERLVRDIQPSIPEGVKLTARSKEMPPMFETWYDKYPKFTNDFEDTRFYDRL